MTGRDPRTEQGDRVANTFALCLPDMRKVDRGKLEKELGGLKLNAYGRVTAIMSFGSIKAKSAFLVAKWDGLAQKDEDWKRLLAAPDAGAKAWHQDFAAHKAAFEAVAQFEAKAATGSKKALAGCAPPLRKLFIDYLAGRKVKSIEEARSLDAVAYPLAVALMRCDVAEGRFLAASTAHGLFFANNATREQRGPRHAGYYATLAVLNEILADREKFPLDRLPYLPGTGRKVVEKAYSETFNQVSYDKAEGQIDKVKPGKETATVTFKTVKWKEPTYKCKRTNRIARIDSDGNIQYEENCKVTGHETKTSTESPVEVPLDFVGGLKTGQMAAFALDTKGGKRLGIPTGVYGDPDKKKFLGFYGVTSDSTRAKSLPSSSSVRQRRIDRAAASPDAVAPRTPWPRVEAPHIVSPSISVRTGQASGPSWPRLFSVPYRQPSVVPTKCRFDRGVPSSAKTRRRSSPGTIRPRPRIMRARRSSFMRR